MLLAAPMASMAQQELAAKDRRETELYIEGKNKRNFEDWKSIGFYCASDAPKHPHAAQICSNTYTNAEFLAATASIPLERVRDGYELGFRSVAGDSLILEVKIFATERGNPMAMHAAIQAYTGYLRATEGGERRGPRVKPRSGDLILWKREVIGASAGSGEDLVQPMSQGIEQHLKQFFADFLKARK